ncbi:MAG: hypothetical protein IJQ80_00985 [Clostridia bacterium]|nr:hypothetical protein [Clostridia bacterium]
MNKKKSTAGAAKSVALSGILSALCFVIMYIGAVTDILDLSVVVLSALIVVVAVIELGGRYPWMIWLVASILCMLFLPRKDIALEFVLFGGVYPMIKSLVERLPVVLAWILKLAYFNAVFTAWFFLSVRFFGIGTDVIGVKLGTVAYLAANAFFIFTDVCFSFMISAYMTRLRKKFKFGKNKS